VHATIRTLECRTKKNAVCVSRRIQAVGKWPRSIHGGGNHATKRKNTAPVPQAHGLGQNLDQSWRSGVGCGRHDCGVSRWRRQPRCNGDPAAAGLRCRAGPALTSLPAAGHRGVSGGCCSCPTAPCGGRTRAAGGAGLQAHGVAVAGPASADLPPSALSRTGPDGSSHFDCSNVATTL
jgi:hypothetical protein